MDLCRIYKFYESQYIFENLWVGKTQYKLQLNLLPIFKYGFLGWNFVEIKKFMILSRPKSMVQSTKNRSNCLYKSENM